MKVSNNLDGHSLLSDMNAGPDTQPTRILQFILISKSSFWPQTPRLTLKRVNFAS